jgi:hypothetical protein
MIISLKIKEMKLQMQMECVSDLHALFLGLKIPHNGFTMDYG